MPETEPEPKHINSSATYAIVVKRILGDKSAHPGLTVLDLKGLVGSVITSGSIFPEEEPRLDFQPVIIVMSDYFQKQSKIHPVVLQEKLYSLTGLAQRLHTTPEDVQARITGKTLHQLDPEVMRIIAESENPNYPLYLQNLIFPTAIENVKKELANTKSELYAGDTSDITTISSRYISRSLSEMETVYLLALADVSSQTTVTPEGQFPIGLSETYLYKLWERIKVLFPATEPLVDFDPVIAGLSPVMQEVTGISLIPMMQLYSDHTQVNNIQRTVPLSQASQDAYSILSHFDNFAIEAATDAAIKRLQDNISKS